MSLSLVPITAYLPAILAAIQTQASTIIQAEPGAGKTTALPAALLAALPGSIIVLEPRRLAARLAAEFVAKSIGEECGQTVGFQVRFERRMGADTRLLYVTEGVFMRMVLANPKLQGVSAVIIDEFHERHVDTDLALSLLKSVQAEARPDLRIIVMSATLEQAALQSFLPNSTHFAVPGRQFPVVLEYPEFPAQATLEERVVAAVESLCSDPRCPGNILVFLTGMEEILRLARTLERRPRLNNVLILPLTADLNPREQGRIFQPSTQRKVILSTNVAETSLTLPQITGVIDSGLAKISGHAAWSGLKTLSVQRISQASCIQRSGRAGRTAPGICLRLFTEAEYLARRPHTLPEIQRTDLAQTLLTVHALAAQLDLPQELLPWFEAPAPESLRQAEELLCRLGALSASMKITAIGLRMAALPLDPRLAAMVLAEPTPLIVLAAALIHEGMLLARTTTATTHAACDVLHQLEILVKGESGARQSADLDRRRQQRILASFRQICQHLGLRPGLPPPPYADNALTAALLKGFPDRVAQFSQVRGERRRAYSLCLGRGGVLADSSVCRDEAYIIAIEAQESHAKAQGGFSTQITVASGLRWEELLADSSGLLREEEVEEWQETQGRFIRFSRLYYGQLLLEEKRLSLAATSEQQLETMLRRSWPKPFESAIDLDIYHARLDLLLQQNIDLDLPRFEGEMFELLLAAICTGKNHFAAIKEQSLAAYISEQLTPEQNRQLAHLTPPSLRLASGRHLNIHYEPGKAPWAASRLQDFFGLRTNPTIMNGRLPLTLHLLAPNQRAVQVTSDLLSFWRGAYHEVRGALSRRYPRHLWPDDPLTATPPPPQRPR